MKKLLALVGSAGLAIGCSSEVIVGDATGTTGAGGATSSNTTVSSTSSFATTTTSTVGAGGSNGCSDPNLFIDVQGDGFFLHFDASCSPEGHLVWPGGPAAPGPPPPEPPPPEPQTYMSISACSFLPGTDQIIIGAGYTYWPGFAANASAYLTYMGVDYTEIPAQTGVLEVTQMEMVGGVIEGTFKAMVSPPGSAMASFEIYGNFRVCRAPDVIPV